MRTKVRSSELQGSDWEETAMVTRNHQPRSVASSASISAIATPMLQPQELVMPAAAAGG